MNLRKSKRKKVAFWFLRELRFGKTLHKLIEFIKNNPVCLSVLTLLKILNNFKLIIIVLIPVIRKYLNKQKYVNFFGLSNTSVTIRLYKNKKS